MTDVQLTMSDVVEIRAALTEARDRCAYHGIDSERAGMWRGQPRCEGCRLPYRVRRAREVLDAAQRAACEPDLTIGQGLRLEDVREWTAEEMGIGGGGER